jgi:hypothetical protein
MGVQRAPWPPARRRGWRGGARPAPGARGVGSRPPRPPRPACLPATAALACHRVAATRRSALPCARAPWPWGGRRRRGSPWPPAARRAIPRRASPWGRACRGCGVQAALSPRRPTARCAWPRARSPATPARPSPRPLAPAWRPSRLAGSVHAPRGPGRGRRPGPGPLGGGARGPPRPRRGGGASRAHAWGACAPACLAGRGARGRGASAKPTSHGVPVTRPSRRPWRATGPAQRRPADARGAGRGAMSGARPGALRRSGGLPGRARGGGEAHETRQQPWPLWAPRPVDRASGAERATPRGGRPEPGASGSAGAQQPAPASRLVVAGVARAGEPTVGACPLRLAGSAVAAERRASPPRGPPGSRGRPPAGAPPGPAGSPRRGGQRDSTTGAHPAQPGARSTVCGPHLKALGRAVGSDRAPALHCLRDKGLTPF